MTIVTFDVFDTLLTRAVLEPHAVFADLARQLGVADPAAFVADRQHAERRAAGYAGLHRPTLAAIHADLAAGRPLAPTGGWPDAEIAAEERVVRPVPGAAEFVAAARAGADRVLFLSDMYLPDDVIRGWLERFGFWQPGDQLLVSATVGHAKVDGSLFRRLSAEHPAARFVHSGNDPTADVRRPATAGWRTVPMTAANPNRYERAAAAAGLGPVGQRLFGAVRLARLDAVAHGADPVYAGVAAGVVLPVLVAWGVWLLAVARRRGKRVLYCVSRDGFLLARLLPRLAATAGADVRVVYLHGSRRAWNLAGLGENVPDPPPDWLTGGIDVRPAATILARLGLGPADLTGLPVPADRPRLSIDEQQAVLKFASVGPAADRVRANAAAARDRLHRYLKSIGFDPAEPAAVVDLGWHGRCRAAFVAAVAPAALDWYYFGLLRSADDMHAYFYDRDRRTGERAGNRFNVLLETLLVADHGPVTGYDDLGRPHFGPADPRAAGQLAVLDRVFDVFFEHGPAWSLDELSAEDLRPAVRAVLDELYHRPTDEEAAVWADLDHADELAAESAVRFVRPFRWRDLPTLLRAGEPPFVSPAAWVGGSWRRTPAAVRLAARVGWRLLRPWRR